MKDRQGNLETKWKIKGLVIALDGMVQFFF